MLKNILKGVFILLAVLFIAIASFSFFYADKVKGIVITEINKKLNAPAGVKEITFSAFKNFPRVSVVFEEVLIREKVSSNPDTLLYAKKITFLFDLMQLLSKEYAVKKINVYNGIFKLKTDKDGNNNYEIWKTDTSSANKDQDNFKLESVMFQESSILYINDLKKISFKTFISDGSFNGNFSKQIYDLGATAELTVNNFKAEGIRYISQKTGKIGFILKIDHSKKLYSFKSADVQLADLHFLIDGNCSKTPEGMLTDLHVSSPGSGPQALLSLVPFKNENRLNEYNYSGAVNFDMMITGLISKTSSPMVKVKFGADRVEIHPKSGGESLKQISFVGYYTNRTGKSGAVSYLSIKQFHALLKGQTLNGNMEITDFQKPLLRLQLNGSIDMALLALYFKPEKINLTGGLIRSDFTFEGNPGIISTYKASGSLSISNLTFSLKKSLRTFNVINTTLAFSGNTIEIQSLNGNTGVSTFNMSGTVTNFYSYLLFPEQKLFLKGRLTSDQLVIDDFISNSGSNEGKDSLAVTAGLDRINAEITIEIITLQFKKFESHDLNGLVILQNKVLSTPGLSFKSMNGTATVKGIVNASRQDSILVSAEASIKKIDITSLFFQMGNFGQHIIEDKNLKGLATAEIQFVSTWSSDLICNTNKVFTNADLLIENGELVNFEPTQALSKYIKGVDFRNIKFSTLKNNVQIKNRIIYFSTMEIKSSAMDITTSGTHTFDNLVDYKIKLLLSQVLGKKVKEQNTEFGTIEDDGLGRTKIYIRMFGPMKNPKFSYDNKSMEEKIVNDIKVEKQNLKSVLNKEFGWFKKDSVSTTKDENLNKKEEIQIDYDEETEEK